MVKELGLEGANALMVPGVDETGPDENEKDEEEKPGDKKFRGLAARLNYLALDRPDLQYASKCISRYMTRPCEKGWKMIKRVGRYLIGHGRMVQSFPFGHDHEMVIGYGDSDWAGCKTDQKSTSGGVLTWGGHVVKTWSSTQQTLSLSSGEAELYALTKTACQTLGAMQLLKDLGIEARGMVLSDSNAAIGMVQREGLGGRTRHIQVQYLWIQERVAREELKMKKVDTKQNPSDLMTKFLGKDDKDKMLKIMRMRTVKEKDANAAQSLQPWGGKRS